MEKQLKELAIALEGLQETTNEYHKKVLVDILDSNDEFKGFFKVALSGAIGDSAQMFAEHLAILIFSTDENAKGPRR